MSRLEKLKKLIDNELCSLSDDQKKVCDNQCRECPAYSIPLLESNDYVKR